MAVSRNSGRNEYRKQAHRAMHIAQYGPYPWSGIVNWLRAKEMEISAALWS